MGEVEEFEAGGSFASFSTTGSLGSFAVVVALFEEFEGLVDTSTKEIEP